tara:strand:- start:89 stop:355 length:267 start_codon:yes stop_codon:yes gene_type:complete
VPSNSPLEYYLPTVEKENINFTPMFFWSDAQDKLLRRKNLADPYSSEMTDNWWGWTTLWALQGIYILLKPFLCSLLCCIHLEIDAPDY